MSDYESVSSNDWDEDELKLHTEDSSESSTASIWPMDRSLEMM